MEEEKMIECVKCHKKKKESEGIHIWGGAAYCCQDCCGDPKKGEHKQQASNACEFC